MARNNALNFNLPSVDDLFSTEESRAEARLEKVVNLNPSEISDFPDHPFKVRMDAAMQEMAESVKQYGVLVPALVRPKQGGGYEMVAGHRRKMAAELAQLPEIPCIVRNLTDDEATIIMVDSNLQREQILPSEKAFAYTTEDTTGGESTLIVYYSYSGTTEMIANRIQKKLAATYVRLKHFGNIRQMEAKSPTKLMSNGKQEICLSWKTNYRMFYNMSEFLSEGPCGPTPCQRL